MKGLSDKLGVDFEMKDDNTKNLPALLERFAKTDRAQDEEIDFQKVRKNFSELSDMGMEALQELLDLAKESGHPRMFEAITEMIRSMKELNSEMYDLHGKQTNKTDKNEQGGRVHIEHAAFVGSPADLLRNNGKKADTTPTITIDKGSQK